MSRLRRLQSATANTFRGLAHAARSERAVQEELAVLALAAPVGFFLAPGLGWYVAMLAALVAVLTVELLNTAVEKLADRVTREWDAEIGVVKDVSSAAVFGAMVLAALVWLAALALRFGVV